MAVDTRDKRFSMLGLGMPPRLVLPNPNGSIDQGDRQQFAYSYRGIAFGAPSLAVILAIATYAELNTYTASYVSLNDYLATVEC